jgi:hypothetical protein
MNHGIAVEHAFSEACEYHRRATPDERKAASEVLGLATNPCRECLDTMDNKCKSCGRAVGAIDDAGDVPSLPPAPVLSSVADADEGDTWIELMCILTHESTRYGLFVRIDWGWGCQQVESNLRWIQTLDETVDVEVVAWWEPDCIDALAQELEGRRIGGEALAC